MADPTISLPADVLRSSGLEILGSGPGTIPLAEIVGAIPEFMAIAATGELPIDIDEVPLAEVESAWQRPPLRCATTRMSSRSTIPTSPTNSITSTTWP
jgi:hypothetical protein